MEKITLGLDIGQYAIKGVRPKSRMRRLSGMQSGIGNSPSDSFAKRIQRDSGSDPFLLLSPMQQFALKELVSEGKIIPSDSVAVSLPGHLVSMREITLPFTNLQKIRKTIYFEVEGQLSFNLDEVVVDYKIISRSALSTKLFVFAVPKLTLKDYLEKLHSIGIDPVTVCVDMVALHYFVAGNGLLRGRENLVIMDLGATKTVLCGINEGRLDWTRTTPMGSDFFVDIFRDEFNLSWTEAEQLLSNLDYHGERQDQAASILSKELGPWLNDIDVSLTNAGTPSETQFCLCGGARIGLATFLSKVLHREVVAYDASSGDSLSAHRLSPCFAQATGLALLPLDAINFRREDFIHPQEKMENKWPSAASLVMIGLVLLMLAGANFYLHSLEKEKDLQRLKDKLRVAFQAIFPDVKNVVNEVKQTEVAIANIRKQTDFFGIGIDSPVQILKHVTDAIPKGVKIYITEFNVEQEKIQVEAQTTSFDSVDQIRSALMKVESFENVTVGDANVTADRLRINFRVQISLKTTKHSNDNTGAR